MSTSETRELFEQVPDWWSESVLGLAVAFAGVLGMSLTTVGVGTVAELLPSGAASYVALLTLLAVANAAVGVGVTYAYLAYREIDPGFAVAVPDREAARWLAGLAVLGPALVWTSTVAMGVQGAANGTTSYNVPQAFVATKTLATVGAPDGLSLPVAGALSIAVLAGVVGPTVGALFHGVLQNSLRRVAPGAAVGGTALAVAALANGSDPAGTAVVAVVAAAAGYAYERTGNLAVPMGAYAVLNAVTLTTALVLVLSAAGAL